MARHPIMRADSLKSLRIPDLMGGLNLRDSVNMINDNQLTECFNMWWADGALKTRPAVEGKIITNVKKPMSEHELKGRTEEMRRHNCTKEDNGRKAQLCSVKSVFDFSYETEYTNEGNTTTIEVAEFKTVINFFWCFGADNKVLVPLEITATQTVGSYFAVWHNDTVYCFTSNKQIYRYTESLNKWVEIEEEGRYIPLVAAACKTNGDTFMSTEEALASGVLYEGYNLLSSYYKMQYDAFNYEIATTTGNETTLKHKMTYFLLENVSSEKYKGKTVTATYTKNNVTYTHSVTIEPDTNGKYTEFIESSFGADGKKMKVIRNAVQFLDDTGSIAMISENEAYTTMEITAPYIPDNREEELERIFSMKDSCWYGGSAEGMDGGTRLFLCGSETEKALVLWSGRNNPLYFPENSYFYVGDKSGAVTGFGKQSNLLVIFKNDETWCTQYYRNSDITANDLINQSVVDYTSSSVYFPLTQINSNIGCAYPDTIALCRNRLVWLSHNGQVYTLVSENQYNERNIFCVSEMVSRRLKEESGTPTATDWNGHYVLCFGGNSYLMDYNCYGYQYVASFSKTEDANIRIPWYYWEMPITNVGGVLATVNNLFEFCYVKDGAVYGYAVNSNGETDKKCGEEQKIESYFTTKLFDFAAPSYKKNIQLMNLLIGNNGGDEVQVELVTEHGNETQSIELNSGETGLRSAGYITNKAIFPCIKAVRLFGVKVSSKGLLAVDGMQFNFRILGGIR